MWGLMHLFFMMLLPTVECPYVEENTMVRYKVHDPYPSPVRFMHRRTHSRPRGYPKKYGSLSHKNELVMSIPSEYPNVQFYR
jgi:hypothetical protein